MKFSDTKKIIEYILSKPCSYETRPFGEFPICYRVAGKIFAQFSPKEDWFKLTLKTNPDAAEFYRQMYPGIIVRGYHCPPVQQPYWNTLALYDIDYELFCQLVDEAYDEIIHGLTKKEQKKLPIRSEYKFIKTDGEASDFAILCEKLDEQLEEYVNGEFDRSKYKPYNGRESIHDVIIMYKDDAPLGCASYKLYDGETVEIKRVYVSPKCRRLGLGRELLLRVEADAKIKGYKYAVLETGELLFEATAMYKKLGYKVIPNYGQYADMPESLCMQKKL